MDVLILFYATKPPGRCLIYRFLRFLRFRLFFQQLFSSSHLQSTAPIRECIILCTHIHHVAHPCTILFPAVCSIRRCPVTTADPSFPLYITLLMLYLPPSSSYQNAPRPSSSPLQEEVYPRSAGYPHTPLRPHYLCPAGGGRYHRSSVL
jgi:hypothetical protein